MELKHITKCVWTPTGTWLASSEHSRLGLWNIREFAERLVFPGAGMTELPLFARGGTYVAVCSPVQLYLLRIIGIETDPPVVTAVRLFNFDRAQYDEELSADCSWCGHRFAPSGTVTEVIHLLSESVARPPTDSPYIALPADAWDEPLLLSACPSCGNILRFNPFLVDNRERF